MIDPDDGRAFPAAAVHRFGTRRSRSVDNWSRGGLSCWIDIRTGTLGPGVSKKAPREFLDQASYRL